MDKPQFDPVVPKGTPNTEYLPKTGHVLSLPEGTGTYSESFMSYCGRVHLQANGDVNTIGRLFLGLDQAFRDVGEFSWDDKSLWPEAADAFFNPRYYMSEEELMEANWQDYVWHHWWGGIAAMSSREKLAAREQFFKTKQAKSLKPLYPQYGS